MTPSNKKQDIIVSVEADDAKEKATRVDPINPIPAMTIDELNLLDFEGLESRLSQWAYYYFWDQGMYEIQAVEAMMANREVTLCFELIGWDMDVHRSKDLRKKEGRSFFVRLARAWYEKTFNGVRNLASYNRRKDYLFTEVLFSQMVAKVTEGGIDSVSITDVVSLMNRRAKISGSDAPSKIDVGIEKTIDFTSDDINKALKELEDSGYKAITDGEGDDEP